MTQLSVLTHTGALVRLPTEAWEDILTLGMVVHRSYRATIQPGVFNPADSCTAEACTEDLRGGHYPGDDGVVEAHTTQPVSLPC